MHTFIESHTDSKFPQIALPIVIILTFWNTTHSPYRNDRNCIKTVHAGNFFSEIRFPFQIGTEQGSCHHTRIAADVCNLEPQSSEDLDHPFVGNITSDKFSDLFKAAEDLLFFRSAGVHIDLSTCQFCSGKFDQQGDFGILPKDVFEKMLDKVMDLDEAFMAQTGVNDGEVYDDDAAFEYMMKELQAAFPEQKMYAMRFVEDYMEYDEAYLENAGLIDWE